MRYLKQSTSVDVPIGPFVDATDGVTAETGLTLTQPDIRLKKNGGAWAQKAAAQTLSHEENGFYEVTLDATDTDTLGLLRLAVFESGAAPVWEDFMVMPANVWDSLFGADKLQVHADEISAGLITATAIATGAIDADAIAADAAAEIADKILGRNIAGGSDGGRTVTTALYLLRNKVTISGGTMTVYATDDSTSSWTSAITQTAGNPVTASDPA